MKILKKTASDVWEHDNERLKNIESEGYDALKDNKVIPDDNPLFLEYGTNEFVYVDEPFIEVRLEVKDERQGMDKTT